MRAGERLNFPDEGRGDPESPGEGLERLNFPDDGRGGFELWNRPREEVDGWIVDLCVRGVGGFLSIGSIRHETCGELCYRTGDSR